MPSSWLLSVGTLIASSFISPAVAHPSPGPGGPHYELAEKWEGKSFLDHIEFFTAPDPTNGYVNYIDQKSAESSGLFKVNPGGSLYMGVDHETTLDPNGKGRDSVRIESKKFYKEGLYIVDVKHMPGSICGTWPAFWSVGPSWPEDGEIDIIEGVNQHNANKIVLHTSGTCGLSPDAEMSGTMTSSECGDASGTIGCVVKGENGTSGTPFNEQGGGVYAMERADHYIKIWYFPRNAIPTSITDGKPNTASFGTPMANLQGSCDFDERFTAQKFVFNTAFCGDWAGGIYGEGGCPMSDPSDSFKSCHTFVAENPGKFKEAYWELNSVQIYQAGFGQHHASNEPSEATTSAVNTASAIDNAPVTQNPPTSAVESAATTAPAQPSSASSSTAALEPETDLPAPEPSAKSVESSTSEHSPAPATTAAPADNSAADPSEAHGASEPASKPAPRSTVYTTSTTTICDKATSSSPPVAALGSDQQSVHSSTPAAGEEHVPATSEAPASIYPAKGLAAVAGSGTPATPENEDPIATSSPVSAEPAVDSTATSEAASAPASTDVPQAAHAPASSQTVQAVQSHADAFGNSRPSSSSLFEPRPTRSSFAPTPSGSLFHGPDASGTPSSSGPAGALFTGAASRVSVGMSGIVGVLAVALLV